jgi:hypothetical protein
MTTDKKTAPKPKAPTPPIDRTKCFLCVWFDPQNIGRAFGADPDKLVARKIADKNRNKYESATGTDLQTFAILTVSLAKV